MKILSSIFGLFFSYANKEESLILSVEAVKGGLDESGTVERSERRNECTDKSHHELQGWREMLTAQSPPLLMLHEDPVSVTSVMKECNDSHLWLHTHTHSYTSRKGQKHIISLLELPGSCPLASNVTINIQWFFTDSYIILLIVVAVWMLIPAGGSRNYEYAQAVWQVLLPGFCRFGQLLEQISKLDQWKLKNSTNSTPCSPCKCQDMPL